MPQTKYVILSTLHWQDNYVHEMGLLSAWSGVRSLLCVENAILSLDIMELALEVIFLQISITLTASAALVFFFCASEIAADIPSHCSLIWQGSDLSLLFVASYLLP